MKLNCSQTDLNTALQLVSRAVSSRPTHPVLANVLLAADEVTGKLRLTGFDLSLGIQTSISASIDRKSVYELVRLFVHDGYGSNAESFLIGESFRWLKKYRPKIKALISYSDPMRGHVGTVYQATNWLYQGDNLRWTESWLYKFEEGGKWQHGRTIFPYYGTNDIEKMKDLVEKDFWIKREMRKHRYVYLLGNKSEKRMAMKTMKHPLLPYPKVRNITESEVIRVKVRSK